MPNFVRLHLGHYVVMDEYVPMALYSENPPMENLTCLLLRTSDIVIIVGKTSQTFNCSTVFGKHIHDSGTDLQSVMCLTCNCKLHNYCGKV